MYCITKCCIICTCDDGMLVGVNTWDESLSYYEQLKYCFQEIKEMDIQASICKECCRKLKISYEFKKLYQHSKEILRGYILPINYIPTVNDTSSKSNQTEKLTEERDDKASIKLNVSESDDPCDSQICTEPVDIVKLEVNEEDELYAQNIQIKTEKEDFNFENSDDLFEVQENKILPIYNVEEKKSDSGKDIKICDNIAKDEDPVIFMDIKEDSILESTKSPSDLVSEIEQSNDESIGKKSESLFKLHVCEMCNSEFRFLHHLEYHLLLHSKKHVCEICGEEFADLFKFNCHKSKHSANEEMACEDSNKPSGYATSEKHSIVEFTCSKPRYKLYKCNICKSVFRILQQLENHMLLHSNAQKPHVCEICREGFTYLNKLKHHKCTKHNLNLYVCEICEKKFNKPATLNLHRLTHFETRPHPCIKCTKRFHHLYELEKHELYHSRKKKFGCEVCNKTFSHLSNFKSHKLTHSANKPHVCNICKKGFIRLSEYKRHELRHVGDRPFICTLCNRGFSQSVELNAHKLIHVLDADNFLPK